MPTGTLLMKGLTDQKPPKWDGGMKSPTFPRTGVSLPTDAKRDPGWSHRPRRACLLCPASFSTGSGSQEHHPRRRFLGVARA